MDWLVLGLSLGIFLGLHALPFQPQRRDRLVRRLGAGPYRLVYAVASLGALTVAFLAAERAPSVISWQTGAILRWLALPTTALAFVLVASAYLGREGWRLARHPMLAGFGLWAGVHALAAGTLPYLLLFAVLTAYSVLAMAWSDRRLASRDPAAWQTVRAQSSPVPLWRIVRGEGVGTLWLGAPAAGLAAWLVLLLAHPLLFGIAPWPRLWVP